MNRQKIAKGLISLGVLIEFTGTLLVVADMRVLGLSLGALAVLVVIAGYLLS